MERERRHEQPPILAWFTVTTTPEGEAPELVRQQWVGVTLPVREKLPAPDANGVGVLTGSRVFVEIGVPVNSEDAIIALRGAGRGEAVRWWEEYWSEHWDGEPPVLLFEASWGEITIDEDSTLRLAS